LARKPLCRRGQDEEKKRKKRSPETISSEEARQQSLEKTVWKIKAYKILIVEDNIINQKLIRAVLKSHLPNAAISIAETGLDGINQWKAFKPDLVLMDLLMPEMDGIEATQIIRSQETRNRTPIIALTAAAESQDQEGRTHFHFLLD